MTVNSRKPSPEERGAQFAEFERAYRERDNFQWVILDGVLRSACGSNPAAVDYRWAPREDAPDWVLPAVLNAAYASLVGRCPHCGAVAEPTEVLEDMDSADRAGRGVLHHTPECPISKASADLRWDYFQIPKGAKPS